MTAAQQNTNQYFDRVSGSLFRKVEAKTSDYTVVAADAGKVFTTRGATTPITFTLPAASTALQGASVRFYNVADFDMWVEGSDEELVVINDATADSVGLATASELIGGAFDAFCDGTSWLVVPLATETQTITVTSS